MKQLLIGVALILTIGIVVAMGWKYMKNRELSKTADTQDQSETLDDTNGGFAPVTPEPTATSEISTSPLPSDKPQPGLSSAHDEKSIETDLKNTTIYSDDFSNLN